MADIDKTKEELVREIEALRRRLEAVTNLPSSGHDLRKPEQKDQHLRLIANALPVLISHVDADRRYRFANKAYEHWYGLSPQELYGRRVDDFLSAEDYAVISKHVDTVLSGNPVSFEYEREIHTQGGGKRHVSANYVPDIGEDGDVRGFFALVTDITELRKAEEDRTRLQEQLHQAQKMEAIGELASGVAHDFNNLLTVIFSGTTNLTRMVHGSSDAQEAVSMIESAAKAAAGVTRSLMTFSERLPLAKVELNLVQAVENTMRLLRRMLPATIELQVDTPTPDRCPWVHADQTQLQQIVLNLAINARDAMPRGGTLEIQVDPVMDNPLSPEYQWATIRVKDNGTGIPKEIQERIFDPFFTTKPRGKGTGLGLAVVRGIVTDHGGRLELTSQASKGTTFTIHLPRVASESAAAREEQQSSARTGNGETILLAEDNEYIRKLMVLALRSSNLKVLQAEDGATVLETYENLKDKIDALILDVDLPKYSGLDCVERIRKSSSNVPVVLVTGRIDASVEDQLDANTVLLCKPFQMSDLCNLAISVITKSAAERINP